MKRNKKDDPVTKAYLEELFDRKFDEKLKEFIQVFWQRLEKYLDFRLEPFEKMRVDFYSFKERMEKNIDWLIGKYQRQPRKKNYQT